MGSELHPTRIPVLPIRNAVIFPSVSIPLVVGRGKSVRAVEVAETQGRVVLVVSQRLMTTADPEPEELYEVGTLCKLDGIAEGESGNRQIVVTGFTRFKVKQYIRADGYLEATGEAIHDIHSADLVRNDALFYNLKESSREILEMLPGTTEPLIRLIERVDDSAYLSYLCAAYLNLKVEQKQRMLEESLVERRVEILLDLMRKEREVLNLQREIRDKMSERINKTQREALLREQMRTIRTELGEETGEDASDELVEKLLRAGMPKEASDQAQEELKRMRGLPQASAEYHVIRSYLEWLASLPWDKRTSAKIELKRARKILDEEHFGLDKVKKRIVQFLAVAKLKNDLHGPILCLVGPPGVGKTSLGHSIAHAMERQFMRTSLGGVRDEAEIRGHRRTYVGAMPGRIIQSIKRAGSRNPVLMLDEIDKLRADFHGDPAAAMLEVLDPEQNREFTDHYIDLPFDLSDVFFIATANVVDTIPSALRDRMEIIEISGYTNAEKLQIAKRHLIPKLLRDHGLKAEWVGWTDEAVERIISHYTREAGVRELERRIAQVLRSLAEEIVEKQDETEGAAERVVDTIRLTPERVSAVLGPERYQPELADHALKPGVSMGLAWTPEGGELLFIEATAVPAGKGGLTLTGQLGDVMKESAQIALSLARSSTHSRFDFSSHDIHIHVPAGAISKDGPSAGVALLVALTSLLSRQPVKSGLAMTGEITLRGTVMPVGGIKDKVLAAHRAGIRSIILPKRNERDLPEIPPEIRATLEIRLVETIDEVLATAFPAQPQLQAELGREAAPLRIMPQ